MICKTHLSDWFNEIALLALLTVFFPKRGILLSLLLISRELPPFLLGPVVGKCDQEPKLDIWNSLSTIYLDLLFLLCFDFKAWLPISTISDGWWSHRMWPAQWLYCCFFLCDHLGSLALCIFWYRCSCDCVCVHVFRQLCISGRHQTLRISYIMLDRLFIIFLVCFCFVLFLLHLPLLSVLFLLLIFLFSSST